MRVVKLIVDPNSGFHCINRYWVIIRCYHSFVVSIRGTQHNYNTIRGANHMRLLPHRWLYLSPKYCRLFDHTYGRQNVKSQFNLDLFYWHGHILHGRIIIECKFIVN